MASFAAAFRRDVEPMTGGWDASSESVKRKISGLTRGASSMWVGIASQGERGAEGRWNAKYKGLGLQHFAIVYVTSSDNFRKAMESELTQFYGLKSAGGFLVRVGCGPGCVSLSPRRRCSGNTNSSSTLRTFPTQFAGQCRRRWRRRARIAAVRRVPRVELSTARDGDLAEPFP